MPHEDGSLEAAQYLSYGNGATIHGEFQRIIVSEHHEDNRGNGVAFGWLAITIPL
jgi:hypothetical protein